MTSNDPEGAGKESKAGESEAPITVELTIDAHSYRVFLRRAIKAGLGVEEWVFNAAWWVATHTTEQRLAQVVEELLHLPERKDGGDGD